METLTNSIGIKAHNLTLPMKSAGHKMTTKVALAYSDEKISTVRERVIAGADKLEFIHYVYIVTKSQKLKGAVSFRQILRSDPRKTIHDIMDQKLVWAHVESSAEQAAHLAIKNNLKGIPLIDHEEHLVGVLSDDAILSIIDHESRDDLLKLSGIIMGKNKLLTGDVINSPLESYMSRAPWIVVGLLGGLVTASVIKQFDHLLEENIILASFIPLVAYVANAVGNQTQTLYIRNIATQPKFPLMPYAIKQYVTSLLIAITSWVLLIALTATLWGSVQLGSVVGFAILLAILNSTTFALIIPRILVKFNIDPATGSGPFSTVIQDFLSVLIYLVTASLLI